MTTPARPRPRFRVMVTLRDRLFVEPDADAYDLETLLGASGALLDLCDEWGDRCGTTPIRVCVVDGHGGDATDVTPEACEQAVAIHRLHDRDLSDLPTAIAEEVPALVRELRSLDREWAAHVRAERAGLRAVSGL